MNSGSDTLRRYMKVAFVLSLAALSACGCVREAAQSGGAAISTEEKSYHFPAKSVRVVSVAEINGTVRVLFGGVDDVYATATKRTSVLDSSKSVSFATGFKAEAALSDGVLHMRGIYPKEVPPGYAGWISFTVLAPRGMSVRVETINGSVTIGPGAGDVRIKTEMGAVTVIGAAGDVKISGRGGEVSVTDCVGGISISTGNGNIAATVPRAGGDMSLNTIGGDIDLAFEDGAGADVSAVTRNGEIQSELELSRESRRKGALNGRFGQGGRRVGVNAINGLILLRNAPVELPPGSA